MENKSKKTGVIHLAGLLSWLPWEETWCNAMVPCVQRLRGQSEAGSGDGGLLSQNLNSETIIWSLGWHWRDFKSCIPNNSSLSSESWQRKCFAL